MVDANRDVRKFVYDWFYGDADGVGFSTWEKSLAGEVANHLSGRDMVVQWQQPIAMKTATGDCWLRDGKGIISIRPNMPDADTLRVLLHEIAHMLHHWDVIPDITKASATVDFRERKYEGTPARKAYYAREDLARNQAKYWGEWAGLRGKTVAEKLIALLSFKGG